MMTKMAKNGLIALLTAIALGGCDGSNGSPVDGGVVDRQGKMDDTAAAADATVEGSPVTVDECPMPGETSCVPDANAWRRCETSSQGNRWSAPAACDEGDWCRRATGQCLPPTSVQRQQAVWLGAMVDHIAQTTGWIADLAVDLAGTKTGVEQILYGGDESDAIYYQAARAALLAFPIGHLSMWSELACGTEALPYQESSRLGACLRPHGNGEEFIVTYALPQNPLELRAGDRITAIDGFTGEAMVAGALYRPMCGTSSASAANRRMVAATSVLGVLPLGTELTVVSPDGGERTVTIDRFAQQGLHCRDPFARDNWFVAKAELRPDGVGVIRLARFTPLGGFQGTTIEQWTAEIEALKEEIAAELDKLAGAEGVVWDLRGNVGGATPVGLAIVGGMPGARETFIAHCKSRIPLSDPPRYYPGESQFDYRVEVDATFVHPQRVAVIIDGLAISAADYFAYAVSRATEVPLVGSPTAGAFGGGGGATQVSSDPELFVQSDPARCADGSDRALEGRAVQPTHPVEYEVQDLVAGRDTLLEAAVALVAP